MQMSLKTVSYGGKTQVLVTDSFCKNLGFGVGFGYRKNTSSFQIADLSHVTLSNLGIL